MRNEADLLKIVADNISALMAERGLNANTLAQKAELNPTGVYDILSGKSRSPRLFTLSKIAGALNAPLAHLLEKEDARKLQAEFLATFQALPEEERKRLLLAAKAWAGLTPSE